MVGITGNFGMGKSAVLGIFKALGAPTISADSIVGQLLDRLDVREKVRALLGAEVFDPEGRVVREKVSDIVFADVTLRRGLEAILHPLVFKEIERQAEGMDGMKGVVVVEAPLLFEGGYEGRFQKTITVYADEQTSLKRLEATGIKREEAMRRLSSQMPISEKIRRSDYSINNSGSRAATEKQVREIYKELLSDEGHKRG